MKNTNAYRLAYADFELAIKKWSRESNLITAFGDFLEMLVCECTPHWVDAKTGHLKGKYTKEYLQIARRYKPKHIRTYYPPVHVALLRVYDTGVTILGDWCDPLGEYFQGIASSSDKTWKGQFFTPEHVCNLIAKLTANNDYLKANRILDPACGSGRMLIAFDRACPPFLENFYVGVDIDTRCARIAALNLFFHGMSGVIICGDSLAVKANFGFYIHHPLEGKGIEQLSAEQCMLYLSKGEDGEPLNPKAGNQLLLFDL